MTLREPLNSIFLAEARVHTGLSWASITLILSKSLSIFQICNENNQRQSKHNEDDSWKIIRVFNGCEVRIENSVTRVTVRHQKACLLMQNSHPKWQNFQFEPNNHYRFFFLHTLFSTIAFRLEYVLFYQFYAKITTFFSIKKCLGWLLSYTLTSKRLAETDMKMTSRCSKMMSKCPNHHTDARVVLHPLMLDNIS